MGTGTMMNGVIALLQGSAGPPVAVATVCLLLASVEWLLVTRYWPLVYGMGIPLSHQLVPIERAPEGSGETATVDWEATEDAVYFFGKLATSPAPGLRGVVRLRPLRDGRVALEVVWAPPLTPILAAGLLVGWGAVNGWFLPPLLALLVASFGAIVYVYGRFAVRAVRELRWAWSRGSAD